MNAPHNSGELGCDDLQLFYRYEKGCWSIAIPNIRLVAEYTTSSWGDDYFFVFLDQTQDKYFEASFYAKGRDETLGTLGKKLGVKLECRLVNSTDFKSRIIWPLHLEDKPLFDIIPNETAFARFREKWLYGPVRITLSEAAKSVFKA